MLNLQHNYPMNSKKQLLLLLFILATSSPIYAYLDPGSGSFIIQMIIAGVLGGFYALKLYWQRLVGFFKGPNGVDEDDDGAE
tara:strand:- start:3672 stop:3917 length:246 start_codon:yes stop_codon:yes gene_type:complete